VPCGLRRSSAAENASSNPAESIEVRLLCLLCVVKVAASATSRSLIQSRPTESTCLCEI
jgi:hypothetical protein